MLREGKKIILVTLVVMETRKLLSGRKNWTLSCRQASRSLYPLPVHTVEQRLSSLCSPGLKTRSHLFSLSCDSPQRCAWQFDYSWLRDVQIGFSSVLSRNLSSQDMIKERKVKKTWLRDYILERTRGISEFGELGDVLSCRIRIVFLTCIVLEVCTWLGLVQ